MSQITLDIAEKFAKLTLGDLSPTSETAKGLTLEAELKSTLKEITLGHTDNLAKIADQVKIALANYTNICNKTDERDTQDRISNALAIIRTIGETPLPKTQGCNGTTDLKSNAPVAQPDRFWNDVLLPNISGIYEFLHHVVLSYCNKKLIETSSQPTTQNVSITSAGFAHHQLLGLLQKAIRTLLVFLKRSIVNLVPENMTNPDYACLRMIGNIMCDFLNHQVDIGLDIRCSTSLAICHLIFHFMEGDKNEIVKFYEKIFLNTCSPSIDAIDTSTIKEKLLTEVLSIAMKDVNRISLAIGVLCSLDFADNSTDLSQLVYLIGNNVLQVDHGTKEAVNLGSARVLEMWSEKLSNPLTPLKMLEAISPLFRTVEFFIFSYIPGHIDAVKNCCRNMLGSLSKIYDRQNKNNLLPTDSGDLIEELIKNVLSQDAHVKWIGMSCIARYTSASVKVLELDKEFPTSLLCAKRTCHHAANESYIALMSYQFLALPPKVWEQRWIAPLFSTQPSQNNESNWPQKRAIISTLLKSDRCATSLQIMLKPLLTFVIEKMNSKTSTTDQSEEELTQCTLLAVETIKIGSELGVKIDLEETHSVDDSFRGLVPRSILNSWLWNENPQIRLAGFSLLAETKKTTELISKDDFDSLKILFKYNVVCQNPAFRQQFIAYFKKLLIRIKGSQALVQRKKDSSALSNYSDFFKWLWTFFTEDEGLFTGANFGRRCQSLECLLELVTMFDDFSIFGVESANENLKYLSWLSDSYENNKIRSLEILIKMPIPAFEDEATCNSIFKEAMALCESVKPPDSVTGRYLMVLLIKKTTFPKFSSWTVLNTLLSKLEDTLEKISKTSLTKVSCETPMYGLIRCTRMIINEVDDYMKTPQIYKRYSEKLTILLMQYDEVLFPLLGNAAPEGFLPGLPDSSEDNNQVVRSITAQMLLVCSWRTMRDSCLLFADMISLFPLEGEKVHRKKNPTGEFILSVNQVTSIGDHMLNLLRDLVHRGVFEQVFVGFKLLATRLWKSTNLQLSQLPSKWLNEAMDEEHINAKCITRRSAGLPFIFQALLSAESDNEAFLSNWVRRLFITDETPEHSSLRVHAMNVLRGLFKDASFSKSMIPFVPDGLRIAFRGLKSENWTERNAGLMLYGAVIKRTFGPKLNLMSAPTFFRRFPQMYDFLLEELGVCLSVLETQTSKRQSEGSNTDNNQFDFTFHLLLLLSAFAPAGRVEDEHFRLAEFIPKLRDCAGSPDIEVRKLAGKAIIPFLSSPNDISLALQIVQELSKLDITKTSPNFLHGSFIQIAVIMKCVCDGSSRRTIIQALDDLLSLDFLESIKCPTVFESLTEILLAADDFKNPTLMNTYRKLILTYENTFDYNVIRHRNTVPGLPIADTMISKAIILFELSTAESNNNIRSQVYNWLSSSKSQSLMDQLLEELCAPENSSLVDIIFNLELGPESSVLLNSLINRYLFTEMNYVGQSLLESNFLDLLTRINVQAYNVWLNSNDNDSLALQSFLDHLVIICKGTSSTTEHKKLSLRILLILAFGTEIELLPEQQDFLCTMLVEWSDSSVDDDLRFGCAMSFPKIPFSNLGNFSVINQCKIWMTILKLVQDDDSEVRSLINSKLSRQSDKASCDRKSLEAVVELFFETVISHRPLEGLTVLLGLLLRDDYELKAEAAHDDEEGRLFDKSEMNMYCEPTTLAKITKQYLKSKTSKSFKAEFQKCLNPELVELYELSSNSKLFICSCTLESITDIVKLKIKYDQYESDKIEHNNTQSFCIPKGSLMSRVQSNIVSVIEEIFLEK